MNQLTFLSGEPPANPSASRGFAKGLPTPEAISCLRFLQSLNVSGLNGLSGKTYPASCQVAEDGILAPSSGRWGSWGMGSPTEFSTLNGSEWPSAAAVCSLSDTLETGAVPQRFFLSAKACAGILRRAEKRGKALPPPLRDALLAVANQT